MSIFDFPRINFAGTATLNPGTANNDDYSGSYRSEKNGANLALIDSAKVEPITHGMSDPEFLDWIVHQQAFHSTGSPSKTSQIIPAEWNYYGDMGSRTDARVTGVQIDAATLLTEEVADQPLSRLVGAPITMSGNITDVNSEGSPPATQFFLNGFALKLGDIVIEGTASKAACQWIYFTRNVAMAGDAGASGYMYHTIEKGTVSLPGISRDDIVGMVLRYCIFAKHGGAGTNAAIEALFAKQQTNPAQFQIAGTLAPLLASEKVRTGPVGRLLACDVPAIDVPDTPNNTGDGKLALAPAVLATRDDRISVDFLGSFPEQMDPSVPDWSNPVLKNPKFEFGPVSLAVCSGDDCATIGDVPYTDTAGGDSRGWIFDFDISDNPAARKALEDPGARFCLMSDEYGNVLEEAEYFFLTNQQAIYAEQGGSPAQCINQGLPRESATFFLFHRGTELTTETAPPVTIWGYRTTPLGFSGDRVTLDTQAKPEAPISFRTDEPGNFLLTFGIAGANGPTAAEPPESYKKYISAPHTTLTNRTTISIRVLPNEDFSDKLEVGKTGPVTKASVPFEFIYRKTLRTYDLLFPAMRKIFPLDDEAVVAQQAQMILQRTDLSLWHSPGFMPITRDMSESRRALLQAWCRRVLETEPAER